MIIIDSSVAAKWLLEENESHRELAINILDLFLNGKEKLLAPDIILYELGNLLSNKSALDSEEVQTNWQLFVSYKLPIFTPNNNFIADCVKLSKEYKVSVYDASYAILAREKNCDLITADEKFVKAINLPFVKMLSEYA